jgi:hypothetical protein
MSFVELGDALFRGHLRGNEGVARFTLTAGAINAVDTVNIQGGAVTYSVFAESGTVTATVNTTMFSTVINVPEAAVVEISAYSPRMRDITVDGVVIAEVPSFYYYGSIYDNSEGYYLTDADMLQSTIPRTPRLYATIGLRSLSPGNHTINVRAASSGSTTAWILARYIRNTGV